MNSLDSLDSLDSRESTTGSEGSGDSSESGGQEVRQKLVLARQNLLPSVSELKSLDLSLLQAEILAYLVDGRRTVSELCQMIYGVDLADPSFEMYYARVRRAARDLKLRGLISTPLLGRQKPYRLTNHGILQMASLGDALEKRPRLVGINDILIFFSAAALTLPTILMPSDTLGGPGILFGLSIGVAVTRLWSIARKVC